MRVIHRVGINADAADVAAFRCVGVEIHLGFDAYEFDEADPRWSKVSELVAARNLPDIVSTQFTRTELDAALFLHVRPAWHHGYPQPESAHTWRQATYDVSDYCASCGIGARQKAPFRMKSEPRWGKRNVLQMNWVFDEYFATPEIFGRTFEPLGVKSLPVLNAKGTAPLSTVVQIEISATADLRTDGLASEICSVCGREKFAHVKRGPSPLPVTMREGLFRSKQQFGSDASASALIMASPAAYRALGNAGVKGVSFDACGA